MDIAFDPVKRAKTLEERGLDFVDASKIFAGRHTVERDGRRNYGEPRFITAGRLDGRIVVVVWTPRENARRVMSMRYAHEREAEQWPEHLG
jgi:uncharacterized DUF497 family protein